MGVAAREKPSTALSSEPTHISRVKAHFGYAKKERERGVSCALGEAPSAGIQPFDHRPVPDSGKAGRNGGETAEPKIYCKAL